MKTALIIPARYASTRFPGKPLAKIAGQTMLQRVVAIGQQAAQADKNITLLVATEDQRIADHCRDIGVQCVLTSEDCATGSDRVLEAADKAGGGFDTLVSLQGDAPFTPLAAVKSVIAEFRRFSTREVVTPVMRLRWSELDALRQSKKTTPFTGTTAIIGGDGQALWFSKNILPALRDEKTLRSAGEFSPVHQHIGLYAYRTDILKRFVALPQSHYERLEGLEQLRFLENGMKIHTVAIDVDAGLAQAGIDSPEDVARAEALLARKPQA